MKNGKTTSPKRWIESSGQRSDGHAERDREAQCREEAVGSPEAAPGDDGQRSEEDEERQLREVDRRDAIGVGVLDRAPVPGRVRAGRELPDAGPAGAKPVPEPAERPGRRELAAPGLARR